jgi:hypothetical protein
MRSKTRDTVFCALIFDVAARDVTWRHTLRGFLEDFAIKDEENELVLLSDRCGFRAQADAIEIEAGAKRRLADEYDAAHERGEIRTQRDNQAFSVVEKLLGRK